MKDHSIKPLNEATIVESWYRNAAPWVKAVREGKIESRVLATNEAIIHAIREQHPNRIIDIGCGEGWLANRLASTGIEVLGIDVVPALIAQASAEGSARFQIMTYEMLARGVIRETFDVAVCNFSLLGESSVNDLLRTLPSMLNPGGKLIVQTIHPAFGCGDQPYVDGWRKGSWAGLDQNFSDPAPWYFRTLASWIALFNQNGLTLREIREPRHPKTGKPASILFISERTSTGFI